MAYWEHGFPRYVSAAERRAKAQRALAKLGGGGSPIVIEGNKITRSFWGCAWCKNLESYSDFASRLPRGRSYARNGSIIELRIKPGEIRAQVVGSHVYDVTIRIDAAGKHAWQQLKQRCAGQIGSMVELLQGKLSTAVMGTVTSAEGGLFPEPHEIDMRCSCPDSAYMCKHIAAVLYGIGARLDASPELLFELRQVDHLELITAAQDVPALGATGESDRVTIAEDALGDVFGIELGAPALSPPDEVESMPKEKVAKAKRATKSKAVAPKKAKPKSKAKRRRS